MRFLLMSEEKVSQPARTRLLCAGRRHALYHWRRIVSHEFTHALLHVVCIKDGSRRVQNSDGEAGRGGS